MGTAPFSDIESEFNIFINEEDSLEIYDMKVDEAAVKIANMMDVV